jgi:hypothetical protein
MKDLKNFSPATVFLFYRISIGNTELRAWGRPAALGDVRIKIGAEMTDTKGRERAARLAQRPLHLSQRVNVN